MSKVLFTNSGSEANDTQVKLVWYYNNILGRPNKKKIIARRGAYHGITMASGKGDLESLNFMTCKYPSEAPSSPVQTIHFYQLKRQ